MHSRIATALLLTVCVAVACSDDPAVCSLADNETTSVSLDYGKAVELGPRLCGVKNAAEVSYEWSQNKEVVGSDAKYRFLACPRHKGVVSTVRADLTYGSRKAHHSWRIAVRDVEPVYSKCSAKLTPEDAITTLRKGDFQGTATGTDFKTAVACLDQALMEYPCDIRVAFWAAYGESLLFAQHIVSSLVVSGVNERTLDAVIEERIEPLIGRFKLLADEMPGDFSARADDFDFSPLGLAGLTVHPGGEWDRGDMLAIDAALHLIKGGGKFIAAYSGMLDLLPMVGSLLLSGNLDANLASIPLSFQNQLIDRLERDATFLVLYPNGEGEARLATSQTALVHGLTRLNAAISFVKAETDDQKDDIFKYFDCGQDAVCPPDRSRDELRGDAGERLVKDELTPRQYDPETDVYVDANGNGRYDPPWNQVGPDAGESDLKYSDGETIGTDVFEGLIGRVGVPITPLAQNFMTELAANIKGPQALDLAQFLQLTQSEVIRLSVVGGINVPSLRLSRWFQGPRDLRDFLPLWSRGKRSFIADSEEEPFDDFGYDKTPNYQEPATSPVAGCDDRPAELRKADPRGDDYRPRDNPDDGCDNNEDGQIDETQSGRSTDLGTEGNAIFDFKDTNLNGGHDAGEESEAFYDVGIVTFGQPARNNVGVWDAIDIAHYWPKGSDVGGRDSEMVKDPRNGTLQDGLWPIIDPVYYFFPDAQFNGVLIFDTPTENIDGVKLSDNAELMRFVSKLVKAARDTAR